MVREGEALDELLSELEAARGTWEERTPFQTRAWLAACRDHGVGGRRPVVAALHEAGGVVAAAPMAVGPGRFARVPVRVLGFLGDPYNDRGAFLVPAGDGGRVRALLDALFEDAPTFDVLQLDEVAAESPAVEAVRAFAAARGLACYRRLSSRAPYVLLAGTYDDLRAEMSKNLKGQLRNKRNRLAKHGAVALERTRPNRGDLLAVWDELAAVERSSWKGRAETGVLSPSGCRDFFRDALGSLAEEGGIDLAVLRLDGAVAAYHLGLRHEDGFYSYNLAQPSELDALSPGTVLMDEVIRGSFEQGLRVVDASRGDLARPHLLHRYPHRTREHHRLVVFRRRVAGQLARAVRFGARRVLKGPETEWERLA